MKKYKMYEVLIDLYKEISFDHCKFNGSSFKDALFFYNFYKNECDDVLLVSYENEEDFESGLFNIVYEHKKN